MYCYIFCIFTPFSFWRKKSFFFRNWSKQLALLWDACSAFVSMCKSYNTRFGEALANSNELNCSKSFHVTAHPFTVSSFVLFFAVNSSCLHSRYHQIVFDSIFFFIMKRRRDTTNIDPSQSIYLIIAQHCMCWSPFHTFYWITLLLLLLLFVNYPQHCCLVDWNEPIEKQKKETESE